jgi:signal transduction histidine kinase
VPGTGLGLALVKSLVQHLSGTIMAESTIVTEKQNDEDAPSYLTTFRILLPMSPDMAKV